MEAKKPKIFITGVSGQLGTCLKELLSSGLGYYFPKEYERAFQCLENYEVVYGDRIAGEGVRAFDLSDSNLASHLSAMAPRLIINPAAWTAVDLSEVKIDETFAINAKSVEQMAIWCQKNDVPFIHYSTDYVFDGSGVNPRKETDPTGPIQVYGSSKLEGEKNLFLHHKKAVCIRTSWVISHVGVNFVKTMLRLGSEREILKIVKDQIGAPTDAMLLAEVSLIIAARILTEDGHDFPWGTYHLSGRGETNWHDFALQIFSEAKKLEFPLLVKEVTGITSQEYPTPAKRPTNSRLDLSKIETTLGLKIPSWQAGLERVLNRLKRD